MTWTIPIHEGGAINAVGVDGSWEIEIIATIRFSTDRVTLSNVHFEKNHGKRLGPKQLIGYGRDFLLQHGRGAHELAIAPAERTTGANPGAFPSTMTIRGDES